MSPERRIWIAAGTSAVVLVALAVVLFRHASPTPPIPAHPAPGLHLGPGQGGAPDPVFDEEASLRDPTPLFLPTAHNSSEKDVVRRRGERNFFTFPAEFAFQPDHLGLDLPPAVAVPARPAEALDQNPPGHPFLGMGRAEDRVPALSARSVFISITEAGSGQRVFGRAVSGLPDGIADAPPGAGAWEFLAAVDPAGLVGPLLETVRSYNGADDFFLKYLTDTLHVGLRLAPGFYRISIGP